jgi:hypothetical protein
MSSWKAGDFFRQLATVVIGIVITFGGSNLIQRGIDRKEARHLLGMIREELNQNVGQLENTKEYLEQEYASFRALWPYIIADTPRDIPVDTLKYIDSIQTALYPPSTNALETLKSSPVTRVLKNNELLNEIFDIYMSLEIFQEMSKQSYEEKKLSLYQLLEAPEDGRTLRKIFEENLNRFDQIASKEEGGQMRRYMLVAIGANKGMKENADQLIEKIQQLIQEIDEDIS